MINFKECCATCFYCRTIKTPQITGHLVDYVCLKKGSVIYDINIKNCDEMFLVRTPKPYKREADNDKVRRL